MTSKDIGDVIVNAAVALAVFAALVYTFPAQVLIIILTVVGLVACLWGLDWLAGVIGRLIDRYRG